MRKLLSIGAVVATAAALVAPVLQASPAAAAGTNTTVVLTFDDGVASQSLAAASLKSHGMHGTFYVNTDFINTDSSFLSWNQLTQMQADGNEIGGHGLDHTNLSPQPPAAPLTLEQIQAQVCPDRQNLVNHGLQATSFAYPYGFGYENATVRQVVQDCGYTSARRAWGLYSAAPECGTTGCSYPYADTIPAADPYAVHAGDNPETTTTLTAIENEVTQAETHGGGLVPIVFHEICNGCDQYSVTQANFDAFLTWLQARAASGTIVKTMREVSDTTPPTTTIKCNNAACSAVGYTSAVSVSLSATDAGGSTVSSIRYTTDGTDPTPTSTAYSAPFNVAATTTVKYRAYDSVSNAEAVKTQLVTVDSTAPATTITCDAVPCSGGWYSGDVQVGLSATDAGVGLKEIRYTTDGSTPSPTSNLYSSPFSVASSRDGQVPGVRQSQQRLGGRLAARPDRPDRSGDHDLVRRRHLLERLVALAGDRLAGCHRRRWFRSREHPLHDRRFDADTREPCLHGAVRGRLGPDRQVPGVGCGREHRRCAVQDGAGRHEGSDRVDQVQQRGLHVGLDPGRGEGDPLGCRQRRFGRREHPLHDRRFDADAREPALQRTDHDRRDHHGAVRGVRPGRPRQRRRLEGREDRPHGTDGDVLFAARARTPSRAASGSRSRRGTRSRRWPACSSTSTVTSSPPTRRPRSPSCGTRGWRRRGTTS